MSDAKDTAYEGHIYSHRQIWTLLRDLAGNGWTITLRVIGDPTAPEKRTHTHFRWVCQAEHAGWGGRTPEQQGKRPWIALHSIVADIRTLEGEGEQR